MTHPFSVSFGNPAFDRFLERLGLECSFPNRAGALTVFPKRSLAWIGTVNSSMGATGAVTLKVNLVDNRYPSRLPCCSLAPASWAWRLDGEDGPRGQSGNPIWGQFSICKPFVYSAGIPQNGLSGSASSWLVRVLSARKGFCLCYGLNTTFPRLETGRTRSSKTAWPSARGASLTHPLESKRPAAIKSPAV
jgi:hypothetical protein